MPALRQAWLIFRPASRSAWKSRRIAAIWSGLGRFRMGRSLALCQLYDSHYGWTRIWGAGQPVRMSSQIPEQAQSPVSPNSPHEPSQFYGFGDNPGWCSHCRKQFEAPLPIGIERGGLVGPRLTTLIAYLEGVCHASYSTSASSTTLSG